MNSCEVACFASIFIRLFGFDNDVAVKSACFLSEAFAKRRMAVLTTPGTFSSAQ